MPLTQKQLQGQRAAAAAKAKGVAFQPGKSGNPGGKPVGARNRIQGKFLNDLADDFEKHGKEAIQAMRINDPSGYIRAIASLMPKEVEIKRPLEELTDEQLSDAIAALQSFVAAHGIAEGTGSAGSGKQAEIVSPLH